LSVSEPITSSIRVSALRSREESVFDHFNREIGVLFHQVVKRFFVQAKKATVGCRYGGRRSTLSFHHGHFPENITLFQSNHRAGGLLAGPFADFHGTFEDDVHVAAVFAFPEDNLMIAQRLHVSAVSRLIYLHEPQFNTSQARSQRCGIRL
jgi:hypothetical protein